MPMWCTEEDVESRLTFAQGRNFTSDDYGPRMERARNRMVSDLLGKMSQAQIDAWDDDIDAVPPQISSMAAALAAAHVMQDFFDGEVISDYRTKAGGLYREYKDEVAALLAGDRVLTTTADDNTKVARSDNLVKSSTSSSGPAFTKGTQADGTAGTLDDMGI